MATTSETDIQHKMLSTDERRML